MKYTLVIALCLSLPSFADAPDDALGRALRNLNGKIAAVDRSTLNDVRDAGWKAVDVGVNLAGIIAITRASTLTFSRPEHLILRTAAGVAALGSTVGLIGTVARWLRGRPRARVPSYYQSRDGMNEFFRLSVDDQYRVAARDATLAQFLLQLSAAYDLINGGFPARPDVPPTIP